MTHFDILCDTYIILQYSDLSWLKILSPKIFLSIHLYERSIRLKFAERVDDSKKVEFSIGE